MPASRSPRTSTRGAYPTGCFPLPISRDITHNIIHPLSCAILCTGSGLSGYTGNTFGRNGYPIGCTDESDALHTTR